MGFHLRRGLAVCICGHRAIFLDVHSDRYFCLRERDDDVFRDLIDRRSEHPMPRSTIEPLLRAGIIVETAASTSLSGGLAGKPVRRDMTLDYDPCGLHWHDQLRAIASQYKVVATLGLTGLAPALRSIQVKKTRWRGHWQRPVTQGDWQRLRVSFARTRMLRPRSVHCLTSSLAFLDLALAMGLTADLVIGVRAAPFSAHSWIQTDDLVLNDSAENVSRFVPILIV